MGFRDSLFVGFILLNAIAYVALWRAVRVWAPEAVRRKAVVWMTLAVLLLNVFFLRHLNNSLDILPTAVLDALFFPASLWLITILFFAAIAVPSTVLWMLGKGVRRLFRGAESAAPGPSPAPAGAPGLISRRSFLAGTPGLLIPAIYGMAAVKAYGSMHDIEISDEIAVPVPHLPRALDGLRIVQLSDLHVGPYLRERELRHIVSLTNGLHPDLVAITGDQIDRSLAHLPDAVRGLTGLQAPLGAFAILGNHDISSDRYSFTEGHRGGVKIAEGFDSAGIRTLRNEVVHIGEGAERLALWGLDWLSNPGDRNFYSYREEETRRQLEQMAGQTGPETPSVLLAHHPDTFDEAARLGVGLTLAGHTHGGGQVVLANVNGMPIGISTLRFKYLSGYYQQQGCSLYVNRGIGYLGIPIRINCPPEISRFKLVRGAAAPANTRPS